MIAGLNSCGCFVGVGDDTPQSVYNLPGLSAITYRVGTHASFKSSMLANLSILSELKDQATPGALAELLTRDDDDFAIAFLDAWAAVADILTFYQERIANENYLRTATELRSILNLAREIGYELNPGVAAGTVLAFTMDDPKAPPRGATPQPGTNLLATTIVIPVGTKVQSVPDPGQSPVTFETVAPIPGRADWNQLRPSQTLAQTFSTAPAAVLLRGTTSNLKSGDGFIVNTAAGVTFGIITAVTTHADPDPTQPGFTTVDLTNLPFDWPAHRKHWEYWYQPPIPPPNPFPPEAVGQTLSEDALQALAAKKQFAMRDLFAYLEQAAPGPDAALVFRNKAAVFGHNAPSFNSLPPSLTGYEQAIDSGGNPIKNPAPSGPYQARSANDWNGVTLPAYWDKYIDTSLQHVGVILDTTYPQFASGSYVVLREGDDWGWYKLASARDTSYADFTLSAKVTVVVLDTRYGSGAFHIASTTVFGGSEWQLLAPLPDTSVVTGTTVMLDRWIEGLQVGQQIVVEGDSADFVGTHLVETPTLLAVDHILTPGGGTQLTLSQALQNRYVRSTVFINANAGPATHGESVQEFVGSGDATQPFQSFKLRQPPITHVSAQTQSGGESTLSLWVNDVRWREVPSLIESGPKDHDFVVRLDDNQVPTIEGGDGVTGARFPTGHENLRAVYRKGTGLAGEVRAGQLTLLANRPLGVKGVTNPVPATGAQDFEELADARTNASVSVLTLGRVVSLLDYQNYARAFGGVGKAVAAWSHLGQTRGVVVTVAGSGGKVLDPLGQTCVNLLGALQAAGEPYVPVRVVPHKAVQFKLGLNIDFDPNHDSDKVQTAVVAALRSAFAFQARDFGQPVAVSEVIEIVQAVEGVVAVAVLRLSRTDDNAQGLPPNGVLTAALSAAGGDIQSLQGAELLTLDPGPIQVGTF